MPKRKKPRIGRPPIGKRAMTPSERQRRRRELLKAQREANLTDESLSLQQGNGGALEPHRIPPALPETRTDLLAQYKLKRKRSINDLVEEIVVKIWENDDFQKLVDAIYDSDSVTGSMYDDDVVAAQMIIEIAKRDKHVEVAAAKLHSVKLAMRVALRRYGVARPERYEQGRIPITNAIPASAPASTSAE